MARWLERLMSCVRVLVAVAWLAMFAAPGVTAAQTPAPAAPPASGAPAAPTFKPEELESLVAPIALYPDSVLSQVLMASTYPLEIVHAARWVKANPNVKGDAAVKAVENQTWDVSVKSLVAFPQVLEPMSDKLDWTQKLGDAFLAQERDVLAAVQRLRARARDSGNLKTNEQQKVMVEPAPAPVQGQPPPISETIIRVEPANPQVIYVPAYNPTVVYGSWGYPSYPPYYWPPYPAYYPGAALATGFAWGVGLAAAGAIFGGCNWGGGDVNIDVNRATNIDRNFDRTKVQGGGKWQHDASHRQGVAYRDNASREKYGKNSGGADRRNDYRGREGGREGGREAGREGGREGGRDGVGGDRATASDRSANRGDRQGAGDRQGGAGDRAQASDRSLSTDRSRGDMGSGSGAGRDNAFQGVGGGQSAQRDMDRGRASAQQSSFGGGQASSRGGGGGNYAGSRGGGGGGGFSGGGGRGGGGGGRGGGGRR